MSENSKNQNKMQRAEIAIRQAMTFNTPAARAERLTAIWIGLDPSLKNAFVIGIIARVALLGLEADFLKSKKIAR